MTQPMGEENTSEVLFAKALLDLHERVSDLEDMMSMLLTAMSGNAEIVFEGDEQ